MSLSKYVSCFFLTLILSNSPDAPAAALNWQLAQNIQGGTARYLFPDNDRLYTYEQNARRLMVHQNQSDSPWKMANPGLTNVFDIAFLPDTQIVLNADASSENLAGIKKKVYLSHDNFKTITDISKNFINRPFDERNFNTAIALDNAFLVSSDGTLFTVNTQGEKINSVKPDTEPTLFNVLNRARRTDNIIAVSSAGYVNNKEVTSQGIWYSHDNGLSWHPSDFLSENKSDNQIFWSVNNVTSQNRHFYVTDYKNVYTSDDGSRWTKLKPPVLKDLQEIRGITVDQNNNIYLLAEQEYAITHQELYPAVILRGNGEDGKWEDVTEQFGISDPAAIKAGNGKIYVTGQVTGQIRSYDPDDKILHINKSLNDVAFVSASQNPGALYLETQLSASKFQLYKKTRATDFTPLSATPLLALQSKSDEYVYGINPSSGERKSLEVSSDGGKSFTSFATLPFSIPEGVFLRTFPASMFLAQNNILYCGNWNSIYRRPLSLDWNRVLTFRSADLSDFVTQFTQTKNGTLYAATGSNGIYKSIDNGWTWVADNSGLGQQYRISRIKYDPLTDTLYAGAEGLYQKQSQQDSWQYIAGGLPEAPDNSGQNDIQDFTVIDGRLFVTVTGSGIFEFTDTPEQRWTNITGNLPVNQLYELTHFNNKLVVNTGNLGIYTLDTDSGQFPEHR